MTCLHPDRLFPSNTADRNLARAIFDTVRDLPIVSPHGHTDPMWWGKNTAFSDAAELFIIPDHYVMRMLVSHGIPLTALGHGRNPERDRRKIWRSFAENYHFFLGTPSRIWMDHSLETVFSINTPLNSDTADEIYDAINDKLSWPDFRPRSLFDRFGIEVIATSDSPLDDLSAHKMVRDSNWSGRVIPTYRPDTVTDPDSITFAPDVDQLGEITGCDTGTWLGYLEAHRIRRAYFKEMGATATDHGHPSAQTADLPARNAADLFDRIRTGKSRTGDASLFRAQMLTEYARMSCEDGLVMQLHAGCYRDHNTDILKTYGQNLGFDLPLRTGFIDELRPLLNAVGMDPRLRLILFTLDESTYARELAPLAGVYPCLKLGPPWWFHDSFEGMRRFREMATETAGFFNTVGFNDDTRALCSIPARHDVSRRCDVAFLASLVTTHRLTEKQAFDLAPLLANGLARDAYNLVNP